MSDALEILGEVHYQICNGGFSQACYNGYIDKINDFGPDEWIEELIDESGKHSPAVKAAKMIVDAMQSMTLSTDCHECDGEGYIEWDEDDERRCHVCNGEGSIDVDSYSEVGDKPWMNKWDEKYYKEIDLDAIDDLTQQSHNHSVYFDMMKKESKITRAKRILKENGYTVKKEFLTLDEGVGDILKKIPNVLKSFKKDIDTAKKNKDSEGLKDAQEDIKDLKDEIYDKGILNKFRNNKSLGKAVFAAMAILMLSAGASNAHAAAMQDANLGGSSSHGQTTLSSNMSFDDAMNMLDKEIEKCEADGTCNTTEVSQKVTGANGDGENTFTWHVEKDQPTKSGGHAFMIKIDVDNDGKGDCFLNLKTDNDGNIVSNKLFDGGEHSGEPVSSEKLYKILPSLDKMIQSHI